MNKTEDASLKARAWDEHNEIHFIKTMLLEEIKGNIEMKGLPFTVAAA